ncbi:MAG: arylamine N-acetyltransferase, partial [Ignavibacteriaceae bacterium]
IYSGEVEDISGHFRIKRGNNVSVLQVENENGWIPQYSFSLLPRKFSDFKEMCDFQQDDPASHFRNSKICTIATVPGRITLSDNSLTITEGKSKNKTTVESREEFNAYLKNNFNIVL